MLRQDYMPFDELVKEYKILLKKTNLIKIEFVDELPKTISGKIKRKQLTEIGKLLK